MLPNLPNRGICATRLQKNCDAGNLPVARFVHPVQPHIVWLAVDVLFAGTVKDEEISSQIRRHRSPLAPERRFVIEAGRRLLLLLHARKRA
jgi:hypothetical protein